MECPNIACTFIKCDIIYTFSQNVTFLFLFFFIIFRIFFLSHFFFRYWMTFTLKWSCSRINETSAMKQTDINSIDLKWLLRLFVVYSSAISNRGGWNIWMWKPDHFNEIFHCNRSHRPFYYTTILVSLIDTFIWCFSALNTHKNNNNNSSNNNNNNRSISSISISSKHCRIVNTLTIFLFMIFVVSNEKTAPHP